MNATWDAVYTKHMHAVMRILRLVFWSKYTVRTLAVIIGIFVVTNVALFAVYHAKTYPGTTVGGQKFGSIAENAIDKELSRKKLLPQSIQLKFGADSVQATASDLGLRTDTNALKPQIMQRHWLPVINMLQPPVVPLVVSANETVLQKKLAELTKPLEQTSTDAHIAIENGLFTLVSAKDGRQLDAKASQRAIIREVAKGKRTIGLLVVAQKPAVNDQQLQPAVDKLRAEQQTAIAFTFTGKTAKPSPADIASWYVQQDGSYVISDAAISAFVRKAGASFDITVANVDAAVKAAREGVQKQQPVTFALNAAPKATKTFTYCIQAKNVDASNIPAFRSKLAGTYADGRGWSVHGKIAFQEVNSGCDFRVWLSASDQMPSFGAICDSIWSCTVKPNVIINFDRWRNASDAWNAAGGSLDDYRSMVINHETGHLLGFGHKHCGGAGQAAPVMQQQSIDLQGCSFNPWPLASEQQQLLTSYGVR
jgi:hypothetical protein